MAPHECRRLEGWVVWIAVLMALGSSGFIISDSSVYAAGFQAPSACQSYTGDAHLACLYGYIETLREKAEKADRTATEAVLGEQMAEQHAHMNRIGDPPDSGSSPLNADSPPTAGASTPIIGGPEECRAYTGKAHLNCLYAYIEIQQAKMQGELRAQQDMLNGLKAKADAQASVNADLQRRLAERESVPMPAPAPIVPSYVPPVYPGYVYPGYLYPGYLYPRLYPPVGLSFYFGVPRYGYGYPFYGRHWHHRH